MATPSFDIRVVGTTDAVRKDWIRRVIIAMNGQSRNAIHSITCNTSEGKVCLRFFDYYNDKPNGFVDLSGLSSESSNVPTILAYPNENPKSVALRILQVVMNKPLLKLSSEDATVIRLQLRTLKLVHHILSEVVDGDPEVMVSMVDTKLLVTVSSKYTDFSEINIKFTV
jgi:hypothetical protein